MADAWQTFSSVALSHMGNTHNWVVSNIGIGSGEAWCAAFVCSCAKDAGVLNRIIPKQFACHNLAQSGVNSGMGMWLDGPFRGSCPTPSPGDLILFRFNPGKTRWGNDRYEADHIGIIYDVKDGVIYTAEGNRRINGVKGRAGTFTYSVKHASITGYYRPYWNKVGANIRGVSYDPSVASNSAISGNASMSYIPEKSRRDAIAREIGYVNTRNQPSIQTSNIRLSAVDFWSSIGPLISTPYGSYTSDLSQLDAVPREIVQFFESKGYPTAAGVGIISNIKSESNFKTYEVGDHGTSVGICQWHKERKTAMINYVGYDWQHNLTGQLNYLIKELNDGKHCSSTLASDLMNVPNNEDGAMKAAELFVRGFERPADLENAVIRRRNLAKEYWSKVVIQQTGMSQTMLSGGKEVVVPTSLNQDGMGGNFTNYTYFFKRWTKGTNQRIIANMWHDKGRQSDRGIATLSGYYLVAVAPIFGVAGDKITVVLSNGEFFNAIVADEKGSDKESVYGHRMDNGKINIIEWERVGSATSGKVVNAIDLGTWKGQLVTKIINRGSIF